MKGKNALLDKLYVSGNTFVRGALGNVSIMDPPHEGHQFADQDMYTCSSYTIVSNQTGPSTFLRALAPFLVQADLCLFRSHSLV
jgi:hypothetical protein